MRDPLLCIFCSSKPVTQSPPTGQVAMWTEVALPVERQHSGSSAIHATPSGRTKLKQGGKQFLYVLSGILLTTCQYCKEQIAHGFAGVDVVVVVVVLLLIFPPLPPVAVYGTCHPPHTYCYESPTHRHPVHFQTLIVCPGFCTKLWHPIHGISTLRTVASCAAPRAQHLLRAFTVPCCRHMPHAMSARFGMPCPSSSA